MTTAWLLALCVATAPRILHVTPAGTGTGDGTPQKSVRLEKALLDAQPGDTIRIAAGTYAPGPSTLPFRVDRPNIRIEGGWNAAFDARDPWGTPSIYQAPWDLDRPLLEVVAGATGAVVDGLVIDGSPAHRYGPKGLSDTNWPRAHAQLRVYRASDVKILNMAFFNPPGHAVSASVRTTLEVRNCLSVNARVTAFTAWGLVEGARVTFANNTAAETWGEKPGSPRGEAFSLQGYLEGTLEKNLVGPATGACIRLTGNNPAPMLGGNAFGACAGGALTMPTGTLKTDELGNAPGVRARDNVASAVVFPVANVVALVAAAAAPRPDGGPAPVLPPYAPKVEATVAPWVGLHPSAGVQAVR